ncbi:MAG: hypothetical protein M3N53_12905 [Actinomycetota bacterium]|nr:hypothetical protein [Actinomycetota bacterium]
MKQRSIRIITDYVTLVEEAPQRWSLLRRELAAGQHQLNGRRYAVAFVERYSVDLLDRVTSDEAFQRGLLGISRGVPGDAEYISDLAHALSSTPVSIAEMPLTRNLLVTAADGEWLWWVNPPLDPERATSAVREICARVGWTLTRK